MNYASTLGVQLAPLALPDPQKALETKHLLH